MWLPIAKMVVMFSLATGAVMDVLIAFKTSEVVLAVNSTITYCLEMCCWNRAFGSYVDLVLVQSQQADAVFRKHQSRKVISQGAKLGIGDHIVTWHKLNAVPTT